MKRLCPMLSLFVLLVGCHKNNNSSTGPGPNPGPTLTVANFVSLTIGNWWRYNGVLIDTSGEAIAGTDYQTVTTVVGDTLVGGLTYFVLHTSYDSSGFWQAKEASYMRITGDTLKILTNFFGSPTFTEATTAILPRPVGTIWTAAAVDTVIQTPADTIYLHTDWVEEIVSFGPLSVPYDSLNNCYCIHQTMTMIQTVASQVDTVIRTQNFWDAQDIGPARFFQLAVVLPNQIVEAGIREELVDYHLIPP